jgi:hypothetical protein
MSELSTTIIPSTSRSNPSVFCACVVALALLAFTPGHAEAAKDELRTVAVAEPYLEMHTGPGRGFPVFHVVDRGESVQIVMQRTNWYQVRTSKGVDGWVDYAQMALTLGADGATLDFESPTIEDFTNAKWEAGILAGDFGGANIVSLYGGYSLNPHVSIEVWGSQILGNFSNGWMGSVNVVHETWPDKRFSPFFTLGAGILNTSPKSTIISGDDRTDEVGHFGAGLRVYFTRRFLLRAEYKGYVVFTSRDDNEEVAEWKAGFAFFF